MQVVEPVAPIEELAQQERRPPSGHDIGSQSHRTKLTVTLHVLTLRRRRAGCQGRYRFCTGWPGAARGSCLTGLHVFADRVAAPEPRGLWPLKVEEETMQEPDLTTRTGAPATIPGDALEMLRDGMSGDVLTPGDAGYED